MSWVEKIKTDFTITTGDGKVYYPYWVNASKNVEYNIAIFDFKELAGSLAKRGLPLGTRYAIEILFQGDDNIEQCEAFQESCANRDPLVISHPLYGNILVQPLSLTFDDSAFNASRITGMVIETITENAASASKISPVDKIAQDKENADQIINASFANDVPNINALDTTKLNDNIFSTFKTISNRIKESPCKDAYFNAYNKAISALNSPIYDTITTMQAVREFLVLPYLFVDDLKSRLNMFGLQFDLLNGTVTNLFTRSSKKIYENNAGITISSMLLASVTNIGTLYNNATNVLSTIDFLILKYNQYIDDLDTLQNDNGGSPDSYIPDSDSVTSISQLVAYTVNSLLEIAAKGKQQRIFNLEEDTNIIMLANRIYKYTGDDGIFDQLIENNNIGLNEILILEKGRKIVYYI